MLGGVLAQQGQKDVPGLQSSLVMVSHSLKS